LWDNDTNWTIALLSNDAGHENGRSLAELRFEIEGLAPPRGRNLIAQRRASRYFIAALNLFYNDV
jgi:hypothetical protein